MRLTEEIIIERLKRHPAGVTYVSGFQSSKIKCLFLDPEYGEFKALPVSVLNNNTAHPAGKGSRAKRTCIDRYGVSSVAAVGAEKRSQTWQRKPRSEIEERTKKFKTTNSLKTKEQKDASTAKRLRTRLNNKTMFSQIDRKIASRLRNRLNNAIRRGNKAGSAVRDLGCTIDELKTHLESLFQPGMSWDNWTIDGWHIDHIVPLCSFDLSNIDQFKKACHYTNLQPLWAKENLIKGAQTQTELKD